MSKNIYFLEKGVQILTILLCTFIIVGYFASRSRVDDFTKEAYGRIIEITNKGMEVDIDIEENIPVSFSLPLEKLFDMRQVIPDQIPYKTQVPVSMRVPIKEVISIPVEIPVVGRVSLNVPIDFTAQINEKIDFSGEIEIDPSLFKTPDIFIEINEIIPISTSLTISVFPEGSQLKEATAELESAINSLRRLFFLRKI